MTEMIDPVVDHGEGLLVQHVDASVLAELKKAEDAIGKLNDEVRELNTALANVRADRTALQEKVQELTDQRDSFRLEANLYRLHNKNTIDALRNALAVVEGTVTDSTV